jgi:hypothetical protein
MRVKRTPAQAQQAKDAVKGLMNEMQKINHAITRASKFVRRIERLPLNDVEFRRARSRVLSRWHDLRESLLMPLNHVGENREGLLLRVERQECFEVGERVRIVGTSKTAKIVRFLEEIPNSVELDREVEGFHLWTIEQLRKVQER